MEEILYDGAGNLFRMMDGRGGPRPSAYAGQPARDACSLSDGRRTDGLIVLSDAEAEHCAFSMYYFNNDGSGGVMCGNGGRCAVAFAHDLGIPHAPEGVWFTAAGKRYHGTLLRDAGDDKTVRLKMADVTVARALPEPAGWYLDTGCPHFVQWMGEAPGFGEFPIEQAALPLRHHPAFSPDGVNVDFVAPGPGYYRIRTYERGVEAETLSCGTGIVASAIALALREGRSGPQRLDFRAVGGSLSVDLTVHPERTGPAPVATGIFLTGPTHRH